MARMLSRLVAAAFRETLFGGRVYGRRRIQVELGRSFSSVDHKFDDAKERLNTLKDEPDSGTKLKLYALFKQASVGKCNTTRPGMLDIVGRAKWDAWNVLGAMTQVEAKKAYSDLVDKLVASQTPSVSTTASDSNFQTLRVIQKETVRTIFLNRPEKKNAITLQMYDEVIQALDDAAKDSATVVAVLTGSGDFYCSGNDLSNFTVGMSKGLSPEEIARTAGGILQKFVASFIDFPKPLVVLLNGPAVGIAVTTLTHADVVYATEKATLHTPFTALGQMAEGCSSFMYPRIMGMAKTSELLMLNRKITATDAYHRGLVTEVFPDHSFQEEAWARVTEIGKLPRESLVETKKLTRHFIKEHLHKVNAYECQEIQKRWVSEECRNALVAFFGRKSGSE